MRYTDPRDMIEAREAVLNGQSLRRWARRIAYGPEIRTGITTTPRNQIHTRRRAAAKLARQARKVNR